jgi:hypothetical protein
VQVKAYISALLSLSAPIGWLVCLAYLCGGCVEAYCQNVNSMPAINGAQQAPQGFCEGSQTAAVNAAQVKAGQAPVAPAPEYREP